VPDSEHYFLAWKTKTTLFHCKTTPDKAIFMIKSIITMKAIWNNQVIAESDDTIVVENNHYFPPQSVNKTYLETTPIHTTCPWKGQASYYSLIVDGEKNQDAAWYYPEPKEAAKHITNYVAFWKGVQIIA